MFRRLLSLLVVLPLLLPQGACVCDLVQKCEACADCTGLVESAKPTCGCRKHQPAEPLQSVALTLTKSHTCHQTAPGDQQDEHLPCCPAKASSAEWKVEPPASPAPPSLDFAGLVNLLLPPVVISAPLKLSVHLSATSQPLYLTLLTLRI